MSDNTNNTDIIIATCPVCNEPIYDDEYVGMCQVENCHTICHEHDAPICVSCCEFTCPDHLTTIDDEDYCPYCKEINAKDIAIVITVLIRQGIRRRKFTAPQDVDERVRELTDDVIDTYMKMTERNAIDAEGLYPMEHLSKSFDRLV